MLSISEGSTAGSTAAGAAAGLCIVFDRRIPNCFKKHRPRQALETDSPFVPSDVAFLRHFREKPFLSPGIIFLFGKQPCRLAQALDFECS